MDPLPQRAVRRRFLGEVVGSLHGVGDRGDPWSRGPEEAAQHAPSCPDGMLVSR